MSQNIWGFPSNQSTTFNEALGYKKYVALLTQTGTDAPVATVLENTLGFDVVWQYYNPGYYIIDNPNNFPVNKTVCFLTASDWNGAPIIVSNRIDDGIDNIFQIGTIDTTFTPVDDKLLNTPIEIRVYP
jgi:hypothetical protein